MLAFGTRSSVYALVSPEVFPLNMLVGRGESVTSLGLLQPILILYPPLTLRPQISELFASKPEFSLQVTHLRGQFTVSAAFILAGVQSGGSLYCDPDGNILSRRRKPGVRSQLCPYQVI